MKGIFTIAALLILALFIGTAQAQTPYEALRYSQLRPGGTARGLALGGAYGAVGADFTSLSINPGGLGVYRRSDLMLSIQVVNNISDVKYNGLNHNYNNVRGNLGNLGFVYTNLYEDRRGNRSRGKWVSMSFALGHNRLADFNSQSIFQDKEAYNSYLADFRDEANAGSGPISDGGYSSGTVVAWNTYLLNPEGNGYSAVTDGNFVNQQLVLKTRGGIDELTFAMGGNYNDRLYFGGSIGVPFLTYHEELAVQEKDLVDTIPVFSSYSFVNKLSTTGTGINARFGLIVKVHKYIRMGAAFHTPTRYGLHDNYSSEASSVIDTMADQYWSVEGDFDYRFRSPMRVVLSAAGLIKQYGLISVDYEYANYNGARYRFPTAYVSEEADLNEWVTMTLGNVHTIRAGAEAAIKSFRLRGGYAYSTTPLDNPADSFDWTSMTYSGGIGIKKERYYIDFTYFRTVQQSTIFVASNIVGNNTLKKDNFLMTVGFTF